MPLIFLIRMKSLCGDWDGWQDEAQNVEDALKQLKGEYEVAGKNLKRYEYVTFHQTVMRTLLKYKACPR